MTKPDENLNNNTNLSYAIDLIEKNLTQDEIMYLLKNGSDTEKQVSALKLEKIQDKSEALCLVNNLAGQDGKIREIVSLKISEFIKNDKFSDFFMQKEVYDKFLQAITDINPNVCRNIISVINIKNPDFLQYFIPKLLDITNTLTDSVKEFDFQDGKYKINKEVFKLYWCLEAIYELEEKIDLEEIKKIIQQTKNINEYTLREKTAKILTKLNSDDIEINEIRKSLKNDKNYYVRRF